MNGQWNHKIFSVTNSGFETLALEIFRYQYENNPVYNAYVSALGVHPGDIQSICRIPFLPVGFFKTHTVGSSRFEPQAVFESSGTTLTAHSRHFVKDLAIYEESFLRGFELFYGPVNEWCVLGLLPSYLERGNSSLVYMVNRLIQRSQHPDSGFYLDELDALKEIMVRLGDRKQKTLLIGVSFALLDLAESYSIPLKHIIIIETGGMKGKRKEMIRDELHDTLKKSFAVRSIHSEYGMTELLSQAWSMGNGIFRSPPWMRMVIREEDDPLNIPEGQVDGKRLPLSGAFNVIDLANVFSCSFLATDDIGILFEDGSFEVRGRMDASDIRGCNLLIA